MTPEERAEQILTDAFGAPAGWEHVGRWIADAIRQAVAEEREGHAALLESLDAIEADGDDLRIESWQEDGGRVWADHPSLRAAIVARAAAIRGRATP